MSKKSDVRKTEKQAAFSRNIDIKAKRKIRARRNSTNGVWFGLGMMGLVGWSVTVPTLLGIALGVWLDKQLTDQYSWTLMMLFAGLVTGCLIAWHWVSKEGKEIQKKQEDNNDK